MQRSKFKIRLTNPVERAWIVVYAQPKNVRWSIHRAESYLICRLQSTAPAWWRGAHARLNDPTINDALRIVTGCLRPTPADNLPVLAGIQPAELRRSAPTLSLGRRAMETGHLLHSALTRPTSAVTRRLKSRHPFVPTAQQLISFSDNNIRAAQWVDHQWNAEWADNPTRLRTLIPEYGRYPGMTIPRRAWALLHLLHTSVGRFLSCLYKWGMASSAACECCAEEQTLDHVVLPAACLRGGERDTCLGPPLFGGPPWGVARVNFPYFWWKTYYSLI